MNGLNIVQFIGNLGQDPTVVTFENGGTKAEFSIATQDGYKAQDGTWVKTTDWHNCYATGKTAETVAKYFKKGMRVYVEGKLKTRKWQDKDNNTRYKTEVRIYDFIFLNNKEQAETENQTDLKDTGDFHNSNKADDDLPF